MKRSLILFLAILCLQQVQAAPLHSARIFQMRSGLSSNTINAVFQDSQGFIWVGTKEGLDRFEADGVIRTLNEKMCVNDICEVDGILYVGTEEGLMIYDREQRKMEAFSGKTRFGVPINLRVTCLEKTGHGLLVGTWGQGIFLLDRRDGSLTQYSVGIPFISAAAVSADNNLYVASPDSGIYHITPPWSETSISLIVPKKGISSLYIQGYQIWYASGTVAGCADLTLGGRTKEIDCGTQVRSIAAYPERQLTLGCRDGLCLLNPDDGSLSRPAFSYDGVAPGKLSISRTFLDREGTLWAASENAGLIAVTEKDRQTDFWPLPFLCERMELKEAPDGSVLIRSDQGSVILSPREGKMRRQGANRPQEMEEIVSAHCKDSRGNRFEAVKNCIYKSNEQDKQKKYYTFYGAVLFLYCDDQDQIWIGTDGKGLWVLNGEDFSAVSIEGANRDALSAYSILGDNEGFLWIASDVGIVKIDPRSRRSLCLIPQEAQSDAEHFIPGATLKIPAHGLFFGKRNGLICIHPSEHTVNLVRPQVSINGILFRGETAPLIPIKAGDALRIPYTDNSFTLVFSVQSYQYPKRNCTAWKMEGIGNEEVWSHDHRASFNHLKPGNYTFSVRGRNNDGVESSESATLELAIIPPWWGSRWAIAAYILAVCFSLFLAYRWWRRRLDAKYKESMKKSQENFFIGMVHEIRTPITIIRLALDRIIRDGLSREDVHAISDNLDYMQETVNGILTYNLNHTEEKRFNKKRTDLNALCAIAYESFQETARLKQCRLTFEASPDNVLVMADEMLLRKVLNNLIGNAFKYAHSLIRLSASLENGKAMIRVEDDGPGVKDGEKQKIFELFYKAAGDKVAEASGMGVGLPYSAQIVTGHGGSINVTDRPGGGAVFTVRLPALTEEGKTDFPGTKNLPAPEDRSKPRVVLADDNLSLLGLLEMELSRWYQVVAAKDGQEALQRIEEDGTDIIVSDVMMPVMDGLQLCREIKGKMAYSHIPFILLTAKTSVQAKTEGMESGADAYVEKPFSVSQLHHQIENLLKLRKALWEQFKGPDETDIPTTGSALNKYDRQFLDTVNQTIEQQLKNENISIDALADTLCMSKTNFYRKFHGITGDSPNEYIKNYRLRRAAHLILEGARINEAAYSVGFYSSSYFAKCFKAKYGVLPKDYGKK